MLGNVNSDQPEALLECLKGIFDIVRLVDPESTKVLSLGKDGQAGGDSVNADIKYQQ